jgi:solute carrier family 35, member F1/2
MQEPAPLHPLKSEEGTDPTTLSVNTEDIARPNVLFNSPSTFLESLWARLASIWTKRFVLSLLVGQIVSLCITCTDVTTTELVNRGWVLPTAQTFFL